MIKITLKIKFRAFFVDLLKIERTFDDQTGAPLPRLDRVLFNERGVYLSVSA
jgi:hypothetical protein